MGQKYTNIIIDISHESVDRIFQYRIPQELGGRIQVGHQVYIPLGQGNRQRKGYVVGLTDQAESDENKLKDVAGIVQGSVTVEFQLIWLTQWMKEWYGSTINQALRTVLPVKQRVKEAPRRRIRCLLNPQGLEQVVAQVRQKNHKARLRLLEALKDSSIMPYEEAVGRLNLTAAITRPSEEAGVIAVEVTERYRNPLLEMQRLAGADSPVLADQAPPLDQVQHQITDSTIQDHREGIRKTYLIHGITGSGKTEVYMELISHILSAGRQVIVLIPEIPLTWQTVMWFYNRFDNHVLAINSRMSAGERYDQYERARAGDIDIMIGPHSTLFAPSSDLGLIIIDEEHENAYRSELSPHYDAREATSVRAEANGASLVLGSVTPSLESYTRALRGEYTLFTIKERAKTKAGLPQVEIVDLREELGAGNRFIFSRRLQELTQEWLSNREQIILSIDRRGHVSFVSCRACGEALKCPHCDVILTLHRNGRIVCHYCGYTIQQPGECPACGSRYITPSGTGTQKIETMAGELFPGARILCMDTDATSKKGGYQEILSAFARGDADVLTDTQMIVKGHDFPKVVLVGVLAADLSLYASDYKCGEQTFKFLTQAAGRAGRGNLPGNVIIQACQPNHYCIVTAVSQGYGAFYGQEMAYRRFLGYPPAVALLTIQMACPREDVLERTASETARWVEERAGSAMEGFKLIGPVNAPVYKVNDIYRKILYIKHESYDILIQIRKMAELRLKEAEGRFRLTVQYDLTWQDIIEEIGTTMAVRQIRVMGDEILAKRCKPVKKMTGRTMDLIEDIFETMYEANGCGLAAPQVGVLKRIFVMGMGDGNQYVMINPEIIAQEGGQTGYEGCLSLPDKSGIVTRPNYAKIRALNENMEPAEVEGKGLLARALRHEYARLESQMYVELAEGELVDTNPETGEEIVEE